jgi:hypothetical protein
MALRSLSLRAFGLVEGGGRATVRRVLKVATVWATVLGGTQVFSEILSSVQPASPSPAINAMSSSGQCLPMTVLELGS